jgi:ZIP family zinc transporter
MAITTAQHPRKWRVGVAFGAAAAGIPSATLAGAVALALGIGIQNFPEGVAVALPLHREGLSRFKSFWLGQLTGAVEILAGVAGAALAFQGRAILPYALSFAAGAMIFVVVEEVIPESQQGDHADLATMGTMLGFAIMMVLDVALG